MGPVHLHDHTSEPLLRRRGRAGVV